MEDQTQSAVAARDYAGPEHFIERSKRRYHEEEVPGFGWIRVRNLNEAELSEWETKKFETPPGKTDGDGLKETRAHLIVLALVNGEGLRRFSDSQVPVVMGADSSVTGAVFEICRKHCAIPTSKVDAVAALKALQKNSEAAPA